MSNRSKSSGSLPGAGPRGLPPSGTKSTSVRKTGSVLGPKNQLEKSANASRKKSANRLVDQDDYSEVNSTSEASSHRAHSSTRSERSELSHRSDSNHPSESLSHRSELSKAGSELSKAGSDVDLSELTGRTSSNASTLSRYNI